VIFGAVRMGWILLYYLYTQDEQKVSSISTHYTRKGAEMSIHAGEVLCAVCLWGACCTIPEDSDDPVSSCRRFQPLNCAAPLHADEGQDGDEWGLGICRDCGNRDSCMFEQRVGGAWSCEEYR